MMVPLGGGLHSDLPAHQDPTTSAPSRLHPALVTLALSGLLDGHLTEALHQEVTSAFISYLLCKMASGLASSIWIKDCASRSFCWEAVSLSVGSPECWQEIRAKGRTTHNPAYNFIVSKITCCPCSEPKYKHKGPRWKMCAWWARGVKACKQPMSPVQYHEQLLILQYGAKWDPCLAELCVTRFCIRVWEQIHTLERT